MATIGIVAAMSMEAKPLLRLIGKYRTGRLGNRRAYFFEAGLAPCVLVVSGMGIEPARNATRSLIESESPRMIVSFGIAGAVGKDLAIGDIFAGERSRIWENGSLRSAIALAPVSEAVYRAASAAAESRGARYHRGTIVTVRGIQTIPLVLPGAAVVEMETAGVAHAASARGIPVVSIRAVSDTPEEPIPFAMSGGEEFSIKPFALLGAILRNPRIIPALLRLMKNSSLAARNLAEVVRAILNHPEL
jgi:adenosylhomocysteine nucleosidase